MAKKIHSTPVNCSEMVELHSHLNGQTETIQDMESFLFDYLDMQFWTANNSGLAALLDGDITQHDQDYR